MNTAATDQVTAGLADALKTPSEAEAPATKPAPAAEVAMPEVYVLPDAEQIAKMAKDAMSAVEDAAERLRSIGRTADEMALAVKRRCETNATQMVKNASVAVADFTGFAQMAHALNGEVGQITDGLERAMNTRRPAAADEFGIGPNGGRGQEQRR